MADIIVGEKVINKLGEIGTIISYDDKFISIQYQNRVGKLQSNAFEAGYVKYQNSNLQSKIDESAQQIKNKKEQEAEERRLAAQKAKEACEKMESMAPVGVKFNSVSIRLEPATVSLSSVRSKHRKLAQEVFDECDKDIGTFYEAFKPRMKYITPPPTPTRASHFLDYVNEPKDVRPSYFRSRYCAGFWQSMARSMCSESFREMMFIHRVWWADSR